MSFITSPEARAFLMNAVSFSQCKIRPQSHGWIHPNGGGFARARQSHAFLELPTRGIFPPKDSVSFRRSHPLIEPITTIYKLSKSPHRGQTKTILVAGVGSQSAHPTGWLPKVSRTHRNSAPRQSVAPRDLSWSGRPLEHPAGGQLVENRVKAREGGPPQVGAVLSQFAHRIGRLRNR